MNKFHRYPNLKMLLGFYVLFLTVAFFPGCGWRTPDDPSVLMENRIALAKDGEVIGRLPDGREVRCWEIERGGGPGEHNHFIYVVTGEPADSVTANKNVKHGKTTVNHVEVLIDGRPYVAK